MLGEPSLQVLEGIGPVRARSGQRGSVTKSFIDKSKSQAEEFEE